MEFSASLKIFQKETIGVITFVVWFILLLYQLIGFISGISQLIIYAIQGSNVQLSSDFWLFNFFTLLNIISLVLFFFVPFLVRNKNESKIKALKILYISFAVLSPVKEIVVIANQIATYGFSRWGISSAIEILFSTLLALLFFVLAIIAVNKITANHSLEELLSEESVQYRKTPQSVKPADSKYKIITAGDHYIPIPPKDKENGRMHYCTFCGSANEEKHKFCHSCGNKI